MIKEIDNMLTKIQFLSKRNIPNYFSLVIALLKSKLFLKYLREILHFQYIYYIIGIDDINTLSIKVDILIY